MKNIFKKILQLVLVFFAKLILSRYKPEIVGITGSVGKTTTKEAIYAVLSSKYKTRKNFKNYNNEIGIPLTIIGVEAGGKSLTKWIKVFFKAFKLILLKDKNYPKILVLEMGADRPGDIKYLVGFIPLKIGVVTSVGPAHIEFFGSLDNIAKEKGVLVRNLSKDGYAILNADDLRVNKMKDKTKAKVITFGLLPHAEIYASEIAISHNVNYKDVSTIQGISFKLKYHGKTIPVLLPRVLGEHLAYSALAAICVGICYNLNLHNIIDSLRNFEPPKGRMSIIKGIKNTLIIDDSYNSSPLAAKKALYLLNQINLNQHHKKYAVLGDMLELGSIAEKAHQEIGKAAYKYEIDYLITVGEISRDIVRGAVEAGMLKDCCFNFKDSIEAGKFLKQRIKEGDLILIKGSQGTRMERAVKEIMAEPQRAEDLLVRQGKEWEN